MNKVASSAHLKLLTEKEIAIVCEVLKERDNWFYHYFLFAIHTGMRRSEILALTWHDVDLWKHREIIVPDPKQLHQRPQHPRKIPITETLLGLLLDMRSPSRWVFQKSGRRMLGGVVTHFFRELNKDTNIQITSERLRLTFATRTFQAISPSTEQEWRQIQKLLGHKGLSTTKHYFSRNPEAKQPRTSATVK